MPIDSQIYISSVKAQDLKKPFKDGRSVIANRYREAQTTKPEILNSMIKRASNQGINASYLIADALFGTKATIKTAQDNELVAVLRMKKSKTKYRYLSSNGKTSMLNAQEIYKPAVKGKWGNIAHSDYQGKIVDVELNLASNKNQKEEWVKTRLLFVRALCNGDKPQVSKKDWAVFLTTDITMDAINILEIYAIAGAIEVYFKEAKLNEGLLKEQTETFASHIASIHLTAIRYLMLVQTKLEYSDGRVCEVRDYLNKQLETIDKAQTFMGTVPNSYQRCLRRGTRTIRFSSRYCYVCY